MLYFAYGSNMNLDQMCERCDEKFKVLGPAQLLGYEFSFDDRGYVNIRPKSGSISDSMIWGVLFDISELCLKKLDKCEGFPRIYNRKEVLIRYQDRDVNALIYFESSKQFGGLPKPEYLEKIIDGAKQNNLPTNWIKTLESYKK